MDTRTKTVMEIASAILNVLHDSEEMTTSDLQGCIEAQVMNAYDAGKKEHEREAYNELYVEGKLPDEIAITWCVDDVKEMDKTLTDDECKKVLQIMKDKHDASLGINWDFIRECIYYYKENK